MGYPPFVFNMEWMGYVTNSTFFLWIRLKPLFDGHVWMKADSPVIKQPWKPWWRWNLVWTIQWGWFNIRMRFHAENYLEMVRCLSYLASWLGPAKQSWCAGTLSTDVSTMKLGFKWQIYFLEGMSRKAHMSPCHPTILPSYCYATAIPTRWRRTNIFRIQRMFE
jgi:hypothetical protein